MIEWTVFLTIGLIVGIVTAFLGIRSDRFFAILLMLFIAGLSAKESVDIFLWIMFIGSATMLLANKDSLAKIPKDNKVKFLTLVPLFAVISVFLGTLIFINVSNTVLLWILGIITVIYGLRMIFIHYTSHDLQDKDANPKIKKLCGLLGPVVSGFSIGLIGTSLKSLKIAFAVKIGKMNMKQVYLGNTITIFYSSLFAIVIHNILRHNSSTVVFSTMLIAASLWVLIHFTFEITTIFIRENWRKPAQIIVGIFLFVAAIKVFLLI